MLETQMWHCSLAHLHNTLRITSWGHYSCADIHKFKCSIGLQTYKYIKVTYTHASSKDHIHKRPLKGQKYTNSFYEVTSAPTRQQEMFSALPPKTHFTCWVLPRGIPYNVLWRCVPLITLLILSPGDIHSYQI